MALIHALEDLRSLLRCKLRWRQRLQYRKRILRFPPTVTARRQHAHYSCGLIIWQIVQLHIMQNVLRAVVFFRQLR